VAGRFPVAVSGNSGTIVVVIRRYLNPVGMFRPDGGPKGSSVVEDIVQKGTGSVLKGAGLAGRWDPGGAEQARRDEVVSDRLGSNNHPLSGAKSVHALGVGDSSMRVGVDAGWRGFVRAARSPRLARIGGVRGLPTARRRHVSGHAPLVQRRRDECGPCIQDVCGSARRAPVGFGPWGFHGWLHMVQ
jgi:hypothetical protein